MQTTTQSAGAPLILTLNDLRRLRPVELDQAYAAAVTPEPDEMEGDYDGVLLSGQFPPRPRQVGIGFVNQPWLPWRGKTFGAGRRGANRVRLGRWTTTIWPFETAVVPSIFDDRPTLGIGYELPENPAWLRRGVFDELRRVRGDLYVGKGGIRVRGKSLFVFHWALARAVSPEVK